MELGFVPTKRLIGLNHIPTDEIYTGMRVVSLFGVRGVVTKVIRRMNNKTKKISKQVQQDVVYIDWDVGEPSIRNPEMCFTIFIEKD